LRLGSAGFYGDFKVYNPNGTLLADATYYYDVGIDLTATNSATFTVVVCSYQSSGVGTYTLHYARIPGAFVVAPGNAGGVLTNGAANPGTNSLGDLSIFSFSLHDALTILLRLGSAGFYGDIKVYNPNGTLLADAAYYYDVGIDL